MESKTTENEILKIPAGQEMDRLIAEKIMGYQLKEWLGTEYAIHKHSEDTIIMAWLLPGGETGHWFWICEEDDLPKYSIDISAAWQVVEKMLSINIIPQIEWSIVDQKWTVLLYNQIHLETDDCDENIEPIAIAYAKTAPLAICRAGLIYNLYLEKNL